MLLRELDSERQGAFQGAHNTGFYISAHTTQVNYFGDKLFEGLQRIVRKITAQESAQQASGSAAASTRQRNRERTHACLKKLVFLMNSMQVKSGSELVFPILFDHMSFATHRCWETNLRVPYAKILSAWQEEFEGSLQGLHQNTAVAVRVGFILPATMTGKASQLPTGWLMHPREVPLHDSEHQASMRQHVERRGKMTIGTCTSRLKVSASRPSTKL